MRKNRVRHIILGITGIALVCLTIGILFGGSPGVVSTENAYGHSPFLDSSTLRGA